MKNGWQVRPLGELCDVLDHKRQPITKRHRVAGAYPYYGATGILDHVAGYLFDEDLVLVGEDGAKWATGENTAFAVQGKCWVNNHAHVLRPHRDAVLDKWLIYFLRHADLTEYVSGLTVPKLNQGNLREIPIPLPHLSEQQRILRIVDEASDGIATVGANTEANLRNARALFESHLELIFTQRGMGWVVNRLKSVTTKIGSGATPRGGGTSYKTKGTSLIRSLNVHDLGFKYAKLAFLDGAQADALANVEVLPRDVLLNITGASVARCCNVPEDVLPARVNQHVAIIRPMADKLDSAFLHYLLISKPYKDQLLQTGEEGGSTRQAITRAQLREFSVEAPAAVKEQQSIVAKLDAMLAETKRLASLYEQKLRALEALTRSLLFEAFTGKL